MSFHQFKQYDILKVLKYKTGKRNFRSLEENLRKNRMSTVFSLNKYVSSKNIDFLTKIVQLHR